MYPKAIVNLTQAFNHLPSVGPRTAQRFVFHLLKSGKKETTELALALKELTETIKSCHLCWTFSDNSPCAICKNPKRDKTILCVVAEPTDIEAIEKIHLFPGLYFVLRGTISPDDPEGTQNTKIQNLLERLSQETFKEIILALNQTLAGETTMMFLEKEIKKNRPEIIVTRLARGLPIGSELEYADEITLESALKHRTKE